MDDAVRRELDSVWAGLDGVKREVAADVASVHGLIGTLSGQMAAQVDEAREFRKEVRHSLDRILDRVQHGFREVAEVQVQHARDDNKQFGEIKERFDIEAGAEKERARRAVERRARLRRVATIVTIAATALGALVTMYQLWGHIRPAIAAAVGGA